MKITINLFKKAGVLLFLILLSFGAEASHFRYGTINWEITSSTATTRTVKFNITQSWRYSAFNRGVGQSINPGYFYFGDGGNVYLSMNVTSVNLTEDWIVATATVTHTYNTTSDITAYFSGCCRISTLQENNRDRNYVNQTRVTLSDVTNDSPVGNSLPIYYIQTNLASANIQLSAIDPNNDPLTYSWATGSESGLATPVPSIASSLSSTGNLDITTVGKSVGSQYAMQVKVTDSRGASIPIDFIVQIVNTSNPPVFDYSVTPSNSYTYKVTPGTPISFTVKASDSDPGSVVALNASGVPVGATFATPSGNPVSSTFSWTPTMANLGSYIINFSATDNVQVQTSTSVNIIVSLSPVFQVPPTPSSTLHNVVAPGTNITFTAEAKDPDPLDQCQIVGVYGKSMSGTKIPVYSGATMTPSLPSAAGNITSSVFSWTPTAAQWGHNHVIFTAQDSYGDQTDHEVPILVNTTPTITSTPVTSILAGQTYSYLFTGLDPDVAYGDVLEVNSANVLPSWLTLTDNGDGTALLSGTPSSADAGNHAISIQLEDLNHHTNAGGIPTQNFNIQVINCPNYTLNFTPTNPSCFGADGSIMVGNLFGQRTWSWTGPNGFTSSDRNITNLEAGKYVLTVSNPAGCVYTDSIVLVGGDQNPPVALTQNVSVYLDALGQATIATPAAVNTIFEEDFSNDPNGYSTTSITNWNVTGDIDIGDWNTNLPGREIDLSGFANGQVETKQSFTLQPGAYEFSFDQITNTTAGDAVLVTIGSLVNQSFPSGFSVSSELVTFNVSSPQTVTIKMTQQGTSDANGTFIGNIKLVQIVPASFTIDNGSSDDCGVASITASQSNFTCADIGMNTVTLTVTDNSGKTASANATVNVYDTIKPVISVQNTTVQLDHNGQGNISLSDILLSSSDICGIASESASKLTFDCSDVGIDTVVVTVTDNSGQITQEEVYVTVLDIVPIVANTDSLTLNTCAPITFTVADLIGNDVDFYNQPLTVDFVNQPASGTIVDNLNGTFTYTPGSSNNHTVTTTYVVKRNDGTVVFPGTGHYYEFVSSPGISWPAAKAAAESMTYNGQQGYLVTITSAAENSFVLGKLQGEGWMGASDAQTEGQWKWVTGPEAGTLFYTGQGNAGGSAVNGLYNNWAGGEPNDYQPLGGEDYAHFIINGYWNDYPTQIPNISGFVVEYGGMGSSCVDQSTSEGTLVLTLQDTEAPVALASPLTVYLDAQGMASITASDVDAGSSDACGLDSLWLDVSSFDCSSLGANTVSLSVMDVNGNISSVSTQVTVVDSVMPTMATQNGSVYLDANGSGNLDISSVLLSANDNCGIASESVSQTSFDCSNVGPNTITISVSDSSGNTTTTQVVVNVIDSIAPTVVCQNITLQLDASGFADLMVPASTQTIFEDDFTADAGGYYANQNISNWAIAGDIDLGNYVASIPGYEIDLAGYNNAVATSLQSFVLTPGNYEFSFQHITNTYSDNAVLIEIGTLVNQSFLSTYSVQTETISFTVTSTETVNIKMTQLGTSNPGGSFIGQIALTKNVSASLGIENGSYDACGIASISASKTTFGCSDVGYNNVVLTATDIHGNLSTCTATVLVEDLTAPVVVAAPLTVYLDATGSATYTGADLDNGSNDACGIASLTASPSSLDCSNLGQNSVVLTAIDSNGNSAAASTTVTVVDTISPVIACPSDVFVCENDVVIYDLPVHSDNCSSTLTQTDATGLNSGMVFPVGVTTLTYTATDESGNEVSCSFNVTVRPLPTVSIVESELPEYCQGGAIVLSAVAPDAVSYSWSNGDTNPVTEVYASGMYVLTVTNQYGCVNSDSIQINYVAEDLLSSYSIIASKEVHLHNDNVVVNGGIGLMATNNSSKVKIHNNTSVTGATTFVMANSIDVKNGSTVTNQISGTPTVALPTFLYSNHNNSNITVPKNGNMTLSGTQYGKIVVREGGTLTFTQSDVSIKELDAKKDATIEFSSCTYLRVTKKAQIHKNNSFNPDGYKVWMFVEEGKVDIADGTVFNGSIYTLDHEIKVSGKSNNQTYMNGMYISKTIKGEHYVTWNWDANCDNICPTPSNKNNTPRENDSDDLIAFDVVPYPNPFVNTFNIDLLTELDGDMTIVIYNMNGQLVEQYKNISTMEDPEMGKDLPAGMYFVRVVQAGQTKVVKVNKVR